MFGEIGTGVVGGGSVDGSSGGSGGSFGGDDVPTGHWNVNVVHAVLGVEACGFG